MSTSRFSAYCQRKEAAALAARLPAYRTVAEEPAAAGLIRLGNAWSRALFDGDFYRSAARLPDMPALSLVFVQSLDGNTGARDPWMLGGGATDKHLIYEGLSRVDADAVLVGAATAREPEIVFSIWHPELVGLRQARGRSRHPTQVVVTHRGDLPFDEGLMFEEPHLPVIVITRSDSVASTRRHVRDRPWVDVIDAGEPLSLGAALGQLRARGIEVVSGVGGRRTATALLRDGLVADLYLTTAAVPGGEPNTPFYDGPSLPLRRMVVKAGQESEEGVRFEHFVLATATQSHFPV